MSIKVVAFDFDGTILDNMWFMYEAICNVFTEFNFEAPTADEFFIHFNAPYAEYYRRNHVTHTDEEIWQCYHKHATSLPDPSLPYPGIHGLLESLKKRNMVCGVISANAKRNIDEKSRAFGLDKYFDFIVGGPLVRDSKVHAIQNTYQRFGITGNEMAYIGDMYHDMENARDAGVWRFGVIGSFPTPAVVRERDTYLRQAGAHDTVLSCDKKLLPLLDTC